MPFYWVPRPERPAAAETKPAFDGCKRKIDASGRAFRCLKWTA